MSVGQREDNVKSEPDHKSQPASPVTADCWIRRWMMKRGDVWAGRGGRWRGKADWSDVRRQSNSEGETGVMCVSGERGGKEVTLSLLLLYLHVASYPTSTAAPPLCPTSASGRWRLLHFTTWVDTVGIYCLAHCRSCPTEAHGRAGRWVLPALGM